MSILLTKKSSKTLFIKKLFSNKKALLLFTLLVISVTAFSVYRFYPTLLNKEVDLSHYLQLFVEQVTWHTDTSTSNTLTKVVNSAILFACLALATSLGLPRQIAALVAGINLGALLGAAVATLAATLGCLITFSVARYAFSGKISRKFPKQLAKLSQFISEQTFLKAIVIRILPIGSNFLTNIIAGVTDVSAKSFVAGSFVGFIPQMVIFSLAGSGIRLGAKNELMASAALFIIALGITGYLVKKHKHRKTKENI